MEIKLNLNDLNKFYKLFGVILNVSKICLFFPFEIEVFIWNVLSLSTLKSCVYKYLKTLIAEQIKSYLSLLHIGC